jgi:hypothetical protein
VTRPARPLVVPISYLYLQVSVAGVNVCPRTVPLLLIVAALGVEFRQVASPWVEAWLLMGVFVASEVVHEPIRSGINGQLPVTVDMVENCT